MEHVEMYGFSWTATPVLVAVTFVKRWRGIHGAPPGHHLLLRTRSVHGWGLASPLGVVGLDRELWVVAVGTLQPRSRWRHHDVAWILELVDHPSRPDVGERLSTRPIVGACPASSTCVLPPSATSAM